MTTGIDISVDGQVVREASGYSVTEESTPVDVSDTTGAAGSFTVSFLQDYARKVKTFRRKTLRLEDRGQGVTQGVVTAPSYQRGQLSVAVDSRLVLLSVTRTAAPYTGTLGGYFTYLLGLVGITNGYVIDASLSPQPITIMGWSGEVWLYAKKIFAARHAEISLVSENIVLRPLRGRVTYDLRDSAASWAMDNSNLAQTVQGYYYQSQYRSNALVYPEGGWNPDVQVYQVDANETVEFDIPLTSSLVSVQQPAAQDYVDRNYIAGSVYCVMGNDGLPLPAQQWRDGGGYITVAINEDTRSLTVTIHGPNITQYAPYRIAATAGPSDNYSSLRLIGTGVFSNKVLVTRGTGLGPDEASQVVGTTIDNEAISTLTQLIDALAWTVKRYNGSRQTLEVSTSGVNRSGESGTYAYATVDQLNEFEASVGIATVADFNAYYAGKTVDQFNAERQASVALAFANQAFGNVAGARTYRDFIWWRIRRATIGPDAISYSAEDDTTVADLTDAWKVGGVSEAVTQFNAKWAGMTVADFNVAPMDSDTGYVPGGN